MFIKTTLLRLTVLCLFLGNSFSFYQFETDYFFESGDRVAGTDPDAWANDKTLDLKSSIQIADGDNVDSAKIQSRVLARFVVQALGIKAEYENSKELSQDSVSSIIETGLGKYNREVQGYLKSIGQNESEDEKLPANSQFNAYLSFAGVALQNINVEDTKLFAWQSGSSAVFNYEMITVGCIKELSTYIRSSLGSIEYSNFIESPNISNQDSSQTLSEILKFTELEVKNNSLFLTLSKGVLWNVFSPVIDIAVSMAVNLKKRQNSIDSEYILIYLAKDYANYLIQNAEEIQQLKEKGIDSGDFKNVRLIQELDENERLIKMNILMEASAENLSKGEYEKVMDNLFDLFDCNVADYVFLVPETNLPSNCITNIITLLGVDISDTANTQVDAIQGALYGLVFYLIDNHRESNLATPSALFSQSNVIGNFGAIPHDFGGSVGIVQIKDNIEYSETNLEEYYTKSVNEIPGALIGNRRLVI